MDCSTPGFPVLHNLLKLAQTPVHWVGSAIQPSHPLLSPSLPAFNLSQHQGLFQWVGSLHQVAKVLEKINSISVRVTAMSHGKGHGHREEKDAGIVKADSCPYQGCTQWREELSKRNPNCQRRFKFSSVAQSCSTLCDPMNRSTPGLPVHYQLPESTQTHVHWVGDAIQPSHPVSSPSPPALNLTQHQGLFNWVSSSHQVAKVLEFQLQHQSFQWTPRTDLL